MIFANITWRIRAIIAAALAGLLFIGFATQTIRIEGLRIWPLSIEGFKSENVRIRLDLDAIKTAQEMAEHKWKAQIAQHELDNRKIIQGVRNEERKKAQLAAAAAYADRNRLRSQTRHRKAGSAGNPQADPAPRNDGPGADAELVAVTRGDFDTLVGNTIRLETVREQAQALVDAGLARVE